MLAVDRFPPLCADRGWGTRLKLGGERGEEGEEKRGWWIWEYSLSSPRSLHTTGDGYGGSSLEKLDGLIPEREGFSFNKEKTEERKAAQQL